MIHLVFAPSKSGTTSLYQMLTENSKFPVIQTHGDFQEVGIHDVISGSQFTSYVKNTFRRFLKPVNEFDGEVNWVSNTFDSYAFYFTDPIAKHDFITYLRQYRLRIISPFRDPVSRSVSAMIHWLDLEGIRALYRIKLDKNFDIKNILAEDIVQLEHRPIELILRKLRFGPLNVCDASEIYNEIFKEDLYREYLCVFYILRMYFGFNVCLNGKNFQHSCLDQNDWEFFTFKLENIGVVERDIKRYFGVDFEYELPRARNKEARKKYVIEGNIGEISKELELRSCVDSSTSIFYM